VARHSLEHFLREAERCVPHLTPEERRKWAEECHAQHPGVTGEHKTGAAPLLDGRGSVGGSRGSVGRSAAWKGAGLALLLFCAAREARCQDPAGFNGGLDPAFRNVPLVWVVNAPSGTCSGVAIQYAFRSNPPALWGCNQTGGTWTNLGGSISGSGCIPSGGAGVVQASSGSGACENTSLNDNGTLVKGTEPLGLNLNSSALPSAQSGTVLQIQNANSTTTRLELDAVAATGYASTVRWDGTAASPSALAAGDEIGGYNGSGYTGSAVAGPRVAFRMYAAQAWTSTAQGTYADIATTINGGTSQSEVLRFENDGGVTVPSTVTGGDKGAGTLNAGGLYVNGVAVASAATAPLTLSATTGNLTCGSCLVNNSTNTGTSAMTLNMSASTGANALQLPAQAGLTCSASGCVGEDTTATMYHTYTGAADSLVVTVPASTSITNGYCAQWVVSGSVKTLGQATGACGSGGGGSGTVNSGTQGQIAYYASTGTAVSGIGPGTAKQLVLSNGTSGPQFVDFPDVKIVPAALNNAGVVSPGWTLPASNAFTTAAPANGLGALDGTPNAGTSQYALFDFELPGDWDTATQPYVNIFYDSGSNTSGTVQFTVSTGCMGQMAGGSSSNPTLNANSAFTAQTMATANRAWAQSGQLTTVTTGNSCYAGTNMIVKIALGGTASSAINIYKVTITTPRLVAVQAN
jgi:hypothetical protein